ncbi:MAG TPA: excinuclease ABC subunit UvrB, partial [Clostridiales bacterium]|nr:excinuclease ABC subunit UvrB [Clostridiales bacterium]
MEHRFSLESKFSPTGDQPAAISKLTEGIQNGLKNQVLLGVTGSGKTFTMANVIANVNRPALIIAHNKTLAAQLCNELREFFPRNRVEYFVSYYDYYQPEAYLPVTDTYIEKDMSINDEIDKLRHSATCSLFERRDTIVVASVSCIYGLGAPEEYYNLSISLRPGDKLDRDQLIRKLIDINYRRNDLEFVRTHFRVRGDVIEIFPADKSEIALRVEFFGHEIDRICEIEALTGRVISELKHAAIFPASHYAVEQQRLQEALRKIEQDKQAQIEYFKQNNKLIEAQRIKERVNYDLEMLREMGYCNGIENYSRYFDGREPGEPPFTLLDYFPKDFILFIDESHMSIPQIRGMYHGDIARKTNLVEYGFRLPAAFDNRPLNFKEFNERIGQVIYVSATPAEYELGIADQVVEQLIRPTGLIDPEIEVRPIKGHIDDLIGEINKTISNNFRVLVTTLTKKTAE